MRACIPRWPGSVRGHRARAGRGCLHKRGRKSNSSLGARNFARRNRGLTTARSSGTSGKAKGEDNMRRREHKQAVGQRNVDKEPQLERQLQGAMIIEPVLLADQLFKFLQRCAFGLATGAAQIVYL